MTKKTIYKKIAEAKKKISEMEIKKQWKNTYSGYEYFTPEQISSIVQKVSDELNILTIFHLKRNELWEYWVLEIINIEDWEKIEVEASTAIPTIKATNTAQQIWWCMTYTERYLKMSVFWIADNSLDFDNTKNTKETVKSENKTDWKPRFNEKEYVGFCKVYTDYKDWEKAIEKIKSKYKISEKMRNKVLSLYVK